MHRINRDRLVRRCTILAAVLGVAFVCGWVAAGLSSGMLFAVAIGAAAAVAIFSGTQSTCAPRSVRRRD
jgi:hypothetical protein